MVQYETVIYIIYISILVKVLNGGLLGDVVDTVDNTVEDVVDILLSCTKCEQNIETIAINVPETHVYNPRNEAKYENGKLIGCVDVTASLTCKNGSVYNWEHPVQTIELKCSKNQVWLFTRNNTPVQYIDGCSTNPTCFLQVRNEANLQINKSSDETLFLSTNNGDQTYYLIGVENSLASFVCPKAGQVMLYGDSIFSTLNAYCKDTVFNITENLPSCYDVNTDELNDPSKNCSGSTGVPFCTHSFTTEESVSVSFKQEGSLQNGTEGQIATMCIGQSINFTCRDADKYLWVQSDGQDWLALNISIIRGSCSTVPESQDYLRLLTDVNSYPRLTDASKTSMYTCIDPFLTTSTTTEASTTTSPNFTTSTITHSSPVITSQETETSSSFSTTSTTENPSTTLSSTTPPSTTTSDVASTTASTEVSRSVATTAISLPKMTIFSLDSTTEEISTTTDIKISSTDLKTPTTTQSSPSETTEAATSTSESTTTTITTTSPPATITSTSTTTSATTRSSSTTGTGLATTTEPITETETSTPLLTTSSSTKPTTVTRPASTTEPVTETETSTPFLTTTSTKPTSTTPKSTIEETRTQEKSTTQQYLHSTTQTNPHTEEVSTTLPDTSTTKTTHKEDEITISVTSAVTTTSNITTAPTTATTTTTTITTTTATTTIPTKTTTTGTTTTSTTKRTKKPTTKTGEKSPFTPVEPLKKYEKHYRETADYWCSEISDCFPDSTGGNEGDQKTVKGPKGFGTGTGLEGQCRMRAGNWEDETDACILDPQSCDGAGLSYSIWVKHFNYHNYLEKIEDGGDEDTYMYIMSSGGDMNGHPGFAMYHRNNHFLVAVVSTGDKYWTVETVAQLSAGYWTNVGATWGEDEGLKLFVNNTKVGESSLVHTSKRKSPLRPAQVMLGCHRTSSDSTYKYFNHKSNMDEFSLWRHDLEGEERDKIMGGFRQEYAEKSNKELLEIIQKINTGDGSQADSGANIANYLLDGGTDDESANSDVSTTLGTPTEYADPETFKREVETAMQFLKTDLLPGSIPEDEMESQLHGVRFAADILSSKNEKNWKELQQEQDILGASQTMAAMLTHQIEVLKRTKLKNDTKVLCKESAKSKTMYNKACKMTMRAFLGMVDEGMIKKPFVYPKFFRDSWNMPYDVAGVFEAIFRDEECIDRDISITNSIFDGVGGFVHLGVNRARLDPTRSYKVGSRIISLLVSVDPAYDPDGTVNKTKLNCNPSREVLQKFPVMYKVEHLVKARAHRTLMFHEDEIDSDIDVRRCVIWNSNQSDFGVWDPAGCKVVETNADYTKCACDRMGTFVVLNEEVEPKVVKEEPKWLVILKYVLYGLSVVSILIYILVVAIAKDLKDQLHLMGVNLGIALILGSVVIVLTDFDKFTSDRHMCVVLGTLIQFFYGAVGFWSVALGHASFRAITRGVIGGNLAPNCFMCWGVSLLLTGIPFIEFLHDLGTDPRCFISWENVPKYPFFIPQIICSIFSMFYAIVILTNLSTSALRKETLVEDYGSFARGSALLGILISLTWLFGFLTFLTFDFDSSNFDPIFQVLNSSTGVCLLIFIGVGSNRWRLFVLGRNKSRRKVVRKYAFGLPEVTGEDDTDYLTENHNRQ